MKKFIPYGRQDINNKDIDSVIKVLKSDFLTQGPLVPRFEKAISKKVHANHAIAVNSATSALHIACIALGLKKGDILWTSPITFVASSNAGIYCGAKVDFVDINDDTYNICPKKLKKKLAQAKIQNKLPKILIPVHLCGQSAEMSQIKKLCDRYNIKIIEDASHAIGGFYKKKPIGSCKYSDITVFSFHPVKIITTAEGGIATTNCKVLAEKMQLARSHGVTRDQFLMTELSHGPWYYEQITLGYNYRMTDLQAALGISQLKRISSFITKRHKLASRYDRLLKNLPVKLPYQHPDTFSAFHLYVIRLNLNSIRNEHKQVFEFMQDKGIGVNLHYIPVYRHPYYKRMGFKYSNFESSENYYKEAISIPMYPNLTFSEQDKIVSILKEALK